MDKQPDRNVELRGARKEDARDIARLFRVSSDGVADYIWSKLAEPGEDLLDVGTRRYERDGTDFSYQNCHLLWQDGEVLGMLHAYLMQVDPGYVEEDPVLKPASELEEDGSYYVSGVAIHEPHRGQGLGKLLMARAEEDARKLGLSSVSLIVFEGNAGAKRLYDLLGYHVIDSREVMPHPMIHFTGKMLLMSKKL